MERYRQHMNSSSYMCCSLSSSENSEHKYVKCLAYRRSFMDAAVASAVAVPRPERCWPVLTTYTATYCSAAENTKPTSPGTSTKISEDIQLLGTDTNTSIPTNDDCAEDFPVIVSFEDATPRTSILPESNPNPTRQSALHDACLKTVQSDSVAAEHASSQVASVSVVSRDAHPLENEFSSKSIIQEGKRKNSHELSCAAVETFKQYFSCSVLSRSALYKDAIISGCSDNVKPRSSSCDAISNNEPTNEYFKKFEKRRKKDRPQRTLRKWRKVPNEMQFNLRTVLFPRAGNIAKNNSNIDETEENEMQRELEQFQKALQSSERSTGVNAETNFSHTAINPYVQELSAACEGKETVETEQICERLDTDTTKNCSDLNFSASNNGSVQKNSSRRGANKILPDSGKVVSKRRRSKEKLETDIIRFSDDKNIETVSFYENKIPLRSRSNLESLSGLTNKKLRVKKKWKQTKAHIQIKTKYCRSLSNSVHGQTFFIHHRVMKLMPMEIKPKVYVVPVSLRRIDANKGRNKKIASTSGVVPVRDTWQPPATRSDARTSRFAVDALNADGDLPADVVNIMINLQHRELLPEDYELLLRLDDRVKPKTVDVAILTELKTESVVCECDVLDVCAVCLEPYEVGQTKKYLPCQHYFHGNCIDSWLSNSSMNCPLDATPVLPC